MNELDALLAGIVRDPDDAGWARLADVLLDSDTPARGELCKLRRDLLADWRSPHIGLDRAAAEAEMFELLRDGVTPVTPRERLLVGKVPIDFAFVPPGAFRMGGTNASAGGGPAPRRVELTKGFFMGTTPVTRAQYHGVMRPDLPPTRSATRTHPVANARWRDAREFCRQLSAATGRVVRLPTEAEWEFACRARTAARTYAGADTDREFQKNGPWCPYTHPVGGRTPNAWGLHDTLGHVWEWCADFYTPGGDSAPVDPVGPPRGHYRALRGSGLLSPYQELTVWNRAEGRRTRRPWLLGFRVVLEPAGVAHG